jgi:hypothetical protein
MQGFFCGQCRKGYGRKDAESVCEKCPSIPAIIFMMFVQLMLFCLVAGVVFCVVCWTDFTKPSCISIIVVKQFLNYLGMSTVLWQVMDVRNPISFGFTSWLMQTVRILSGTGSPETLAQAGDCFAAWFGDPYKVYVILGLLWVPLWVLFLYALWRLYGYVMFYRGGVELKTKRLFSLIFVNLYILHPRITECLLVVLDCKHFDKPRLMMDSTVDCESPGHKLWQWMGMFGFVIYSLGIPLAVFLILQRFHRKGKLLKRRTMNSLGFLYMGFEPQHYSFEAFLMTRKVLYQLIILIPPLAAQTEENDKLIKCISMLLFAIVFLATHMHYMPFDNRAYFALDRIEAASLWSIVISLLVQGGYREGVHK